MPVLDTVLEAPISLSMKLTEPGTVNNSSAFLLHIHRDQHDRSDRFTKNNPEFSETSKSTFNIT